MSRGVKDRLLLDPRDVRQVEVASRALALLPASAPTTSLFDALRPCVPLAAGIFGILRPSAPDSMVTHAAWLPPDVFDRWLATPRDQLAQTLAPLLGVGPGGLRRDSETVTGALREKLDVLRALEAAGLGEGVGYKILDRVSLQYGVEHFILAMLMPRAKPLPPRAQAILAALNPAIIAAVLRLQLPLTAHEPLFSQVIAEQSMGYVCLSRSRSLLEANRRAHDLVMRYRSAAGFTGCRGAVVDFAAHAWDRAAEGQPLLLRAEDQGSILDMSGHVIPKESHGRSEDVLLLTMKEVVLHQSPVDTLLARAKLTPTEKKIAHLLVDMTEPCKQIADRLTIALPTVNAHARQIYRKLGVHSRLELVKLLRN
jgi:DNA-binding CsgD family transcriptional regulator